MTTATDAFQALLKTLCLKEFPCGDGSWRKQLTVTKVSRNYGKQYITVADKTEPQFSVTLNDYNASRYHIETLQEFVSAKHSPWTFDYSWSEEARSLRELAVKHPELISDDFIHQHFKTLRLTDKGITDVDDQLLKFSNLEYMTLSANYIKNVNSKNLPRKLLSLELNSNQVSELFSLCLDPPALVHLGLGNNCLTYVDDYLSGEHWPALLSLDLSYNNLTDLPETLRKLKTLPNLRNLILLGNPVMLTAGYRGFVIDNLNSIDLLDDMRIEADERHRFSKMSRLTEQELCQCKVTFEVARIRHAPMPVEIQHSEEQPEYPIITRNYYLDFHYVEEGGMDIDVFNLQQDIRVDGPSGANSFERGWDGGNSFGGASPEFGGSPMPDDQSWKGMDALDVPDEGSPGGFLPQESGPPPNKKAGNIIRTEKGSWSDDIELAWSKTVKRDDLLAVRDFLKTPMRVDVIEETILSYPKEEEGADNPGSAKKKKDDSKAKDDKKGKRLKPKSPPKALPKTKPRKKKKDDLGDMRQEPPELNVLATFEVSLDQFLAGETKFSQTLAQAGVQSPASPVSMDESRVPSSVSQREPSPTGGKKEKEKVKSAEKKGKDKERRKSAANVKKEAKKKETEVEPDVVEPPPPLEIEISIQLHKWATTNESLQAEE